MDNEIKYFNVNYYSKVQNQYALFTITLILGKRALLMQPFSFTK